MEQNPFVYGEVVPTAAFINRAVELERLVGDLADGQKVFLISPRRYGKSSLIRQALAAAPASHRTSSRCPCGSLKRGGAKSSSRSTSFRRSPNSTADRSNTRCVPPSSTSATSGTCLPAPSRA